MADVNAEIGVSIDTSNALAQLKALQREIARFHLSVAKSSEAAALAQRDLQKNFLNGINAIGGFSAELRTVKTTAESFTDSLERNKLSMREYFRYSMASTKTFGRFFTSEFDTINKVALDNVKRLQTQYVKMGRDASGALKAIAITPTRLDLESFSTQTQIAAQRQALFNQLVRQGSTNLLNFGKNTQWAGRQLMVGFTIPLIGLGAAASKTFMAMETAAIKFRKVYGDLFTPTAEREQALRDIEGLGRAFTKYGIAVADTVGLAAEAAAAGFQGIDLQRQVTEATRLQVLGQVEQQKALETTISLQNAFRLSSADLADSINFLNAVENQTVVSLDDITTAIPKAAPIVRELGGDVKDLAFFMAAMKEGGINASEGANALKSGLASLINPTDKAKGMLADFGINIDAIVEKNVGNVKQTVIDFAIALDGLSSLSRQRAIEQLFGKFQQARLSALFTNVIRDGNQASRVLDLAGTSTEELASLAEQELGITANSAMNKFKKSVEDLKLALAPIGKLFLEMLTPFLENIGDVLEKFNNLSSGSKKIIASLVIGLGAIAPVVLMTVGLFSNFVANGIKGIALLRNGYLRLTGQSQVLSEQTNYLTVEQQQAVAAAAAMEQSHSKLQQVFTGEAAAVRALITEYQRMIAAQNTAATRFPGMMVPGFKLNKYKDGKPIVVGGIGSQDSELALLAPKETVLPAKISEKYAPLINAMIADNIPGYQNGRKGVSTGQRVVIPGGMDVSHFGEKRKMSGAALLAMFEGVETTTAKNIIKLINSFEDGSTKMFTVFDNQAVAMFSEINQGLDKKGKYALADVKENLVGQKFAPIRDIELQRQFETAGRPIEEFVQVNKRITEEISLGFDRLGDVATITEEQVNEIIQTAYNKVAQENEAMEAALARMRQITTITQPDVAAVRGKRVPVSPESYINFKRGRESYKQNMMDLVGKENIPYNLDASFNIRTEALERLKLTGEQAKQIFDQMSKEAKIKLSGLRTDIDAFVQEFIMEAGKVGVSVGNAAIDGLAKGTRSASPSQDGILQGRNVVDGFEQGILEGMDDASLAASQVRQSAITGLSQPTALGLVGQNIPVGPSSPITRSTENASQALEDFESVTIKAADVSQKSSQNLYKWNNRLMATSFGLSSVIGGLSMFGKDLGKTGDILFKVSSAMFILQGVVQTLTQAKLLELAATRLSTAKNATSLAAAGTGLASRGGILGIIGKVGAFARSLLGLGTSIGKLVLRVGIVTTALVALYKSNQRAKERIEGLGNAAQLTGEKLKGLSNFFGINLRTPAFENFKFEGATAAPAMTGQRRQEVERLIASEDFKPFAKDVQALKNATNEEAQLVMEGLAIQLQSSGATEEQVRIFIDALKKASGKKDVEIDFKSLKIGTEGSLKAIDQNIKTLVSKFSKKAKIGFSEAYKKSLNVTGRSIAGAFGSLQLQLENGTISAQDYATQVKSINTEILGIADNQARLALVNQIFKSMGTEAQEAAKGVKDLNDKLLLAQVITLGVGNEEDIKGLKSSDPEVVARSRKNLQDSMTTYFETLAPLIDALNANKNDGNALDGKGLTLQEKLIKIYQKQIRGLEKKQKALQDVNDEIDRQNQYIQDQMDLQTKITEAKISGNYLEAAALSQQKLIKQSEFNRESREIELQKQIDKIQDRISELEDDSKKIVLTAQERRLLKLYANIFAKEGSAGGSGKTGTTGGTGVKSGTSTPVTGQDTQGSAPRTSKTKAVRGNLPDPWNAYDKAKKYYGHGWTVYFDTVTKEWKPVAIKDIGDKVPSDAITYDDWLSGVRTYNSGGSISGPGTSTSDSIPILASDGEFMWSARAVQNAGGPNAVGAMHEYFKNAQRRKDGGPIKKKSTPVMSSAKTGPAALADRIATEKWYKENGYFKDSDGVWRKNPPSFLEKYTTKQNWKDLFGGMSGNPHGLIYDDIGSKLLTFAFGPGASDRYFGGENFATGEWLTALSNVALVGRLGNIAARGFIEQAGIMQGIPNLGKLLPQGSIPYLTGSASQAIKGASNLAMLQAGHSLIANKFSSTIAKDSPLLSMISKQQYKETLGSIYRRQNVTIGEKVYPTYTLGNKKDKIAFEGYKQDFSDLEKTGVRIISTTPEGILEEALRLKPRDKKLKKLLDNFKSKNYGPEENAFLDKMSASVSVGRRGRPSYKERTDGFAILLASLAGNANAKKIISERTSNYHNIISENAKKELQKRLNAPAYSKHEGELRPDLVAVTHSTRYPVVRNKDGSISLFPYGQHTVGTDIAVPRASLHFTLEAPVESHMFGNWSKSQNKIVTRLSSIIDDNGFPFNLNAIDTWWMRSPGQELKLSDASVIRPFTNQKEYESELIKRGLLEKGKMAPFFIIDPATKDVLHLLKKSYNSVDRLRIAREADRTNIGTFQSPYTGKKVNADDPKSIMGHEQEVVDFISMQLAKKALGIDTRPTSLSGWELSSPSKTEHIRAIAEKHGLRQGIHSQSGPESLESTMNSLRNVSDSTKFYGDSIEGIRMAALMGRFTTNVDEAIKQPRVSGIATGGYITKKGVIRNFAKGGYMGSNLYKMAAGGYITPSMMRSLPKFKTGIENVPYDMAAILHQGERVLTKEENQNYGDRTVVNNNRFEITGDNPKEIVRLVMVELDRVSNKNNKSNKVTA